MQLEVGIVCGNRQDTKGVGVSQTTLPTLDCDDGGSSLDQIQLQGIAKTKPNAIVHLINYRQSQSNQGERSSHICLPLVLLDTSRLRVPEWITAAMQVNLTRSLFIAGD